MRNAGNRFFLLKLDRMRPRRVLRAIAIVLAVSLLGNNIAVAAGTPLDPVNLKQKLTTRGIGKSVKVTELDGTIVSGNLSAIRDDAFDVTVKKATLPVTISYSQVSKERNGGLSTGAKIGIAVGCVVVAAGVLAIVAASKLKGLGNLNLNLGSL
jgi:hypothetical protein